MKTRRIGVPIVLTLVFIAALTLRLGGARWPLLLHPDEATIAHWLGESLEHGHVTHRVYPNGFFVMAKPVWRAATVVHGWGHDWRYWTGEEDKKTERMEERIVFLREFNAWLGALTCLLGYGLARRITQSPGAALAAALLLAFSPQFIEHAHYAETDVAMMFTLTLALWLWARVVDLRTGAALILAAAATGFAAGTKFTLVALLPLIPLHAAAFTPASPRQRGRTVRVGVWLGAGLLAGVAGFVISNPGVVDNLTWWLHGLRHGAASVYSETQRNLGPAFGDARGLIIKHERLIASELYGMGVGWALLAGGGLMLAVARPWRRHLLTLVAFPAVFVYYLLGVAPWIRPQEVMTLQPVLTAAAAVALAGAWQIARNGSGRWTRPVVLAVAGLAITWTAVLGARRLSHFVWMEPRSAAMNWIAHYLPTGRATVHERYTYPAYTTIDGNLLGISNAERIAFEEIKAKGFDYVLRNDRATGRGLRDPRTGARFAMYQRKFEALCHDTQLLRAWAPMGGSSACEAQFCGAHIQLLGTVAPPTGPDLALPVFQPLLAADEGRATFFPVGQDLGCATGIEVDRYPREMAIGGPLAQGEPVYLVLNTLERGTTVHVEQRGGNRKIVLPPYGVAVVPLTPLDVWPRLSEYHRLVLFTERVKHITYVPCYARVVSGHRQLAAACLQLGRPDHAAAVPGLLAARTVGTYLVAVQDGQWTAADGLRPLAEEAATVLRAYLSGERPDVSIGGIAAFYREELARCRLQRPHQITELTLHPDAASEEEDAGKGGITSLLTFPLRLPAGRYLLCMKLASRTDSGRGRVRVTDVTGRMVAAWDLDQIGRGSTEVTIPLNVGREYTPALKWSADTKTKLLVRDIELRWNERDTLTDMVCLIDVALARHDLQQGHPQRAIERLAAAPSGTVFDGECRRLTFEAWRAIEGNASSGTMVSARAVLAETPRHYEALCCLAAIDLQCADTVRQLAGNLTQPVIFGGKLAIVGGRILKPKSAVEVVVESRVDDLPKLGIALCRRSGRDWKRAGFRSLATEPLRRGERVRLVLDAPSTGGGASRFPDDYSLAVESDVEYFPSRLPAEGRNSDILPLKEFATEPPDRNRGIPSRTDISARL